MKSFAFLYFHGHRIVVVLLMMLFIGLALSFSEGWLLRIPWLSGTAGVNVGTLCSFAYAALPVPLFRNQLSKLEARSPRKWLVVDSTLLVVLWSVPWVFSLTGVGSVRFAYVSTVLMGITFFAGKYLNVDTLALLLIAQLVLQTALWLSASETKWRFVLFALAVPPGHVPLLISGLSLLVSIPSLHKFKQAGA